MCTIFSRTKGKRKHHEEGNESYKREPDRITGLKNIFEEKNSLIGD